jgi:HAE1 family hydrophobic/amphiphilic exporter-1
VQPLVILVSVPLALIGVSFTLDLLEVPVSVIVFIGLILLAGIVVNNAIVLIDRVNQKRGNGIGVYAAFLEAGQTRLRPIYMTTGTTVIGLLPMTGWLECVPILGTRRRRGRRDPSRRWRSPSSPGLTTSTLLTLVVIPACTRLPAQRVERAHERYQDESSSRAHGFFGGLVRRPVTLLVLFVR